MKVGYCKWVLCGITCFVVSHVAQAAIGNSNPESMEVVQAKKDGKDLPYNRFQPYGPSSVLLQQWTEDDQTALEVDYSFKYILYNVTTPIIMKPTSVNPVVMRISGMANFIFHLRGSSTFT